jgi:hypothetical protein
MANGASPVALVPGLKVNLPPSDPWCTLVGAFQRRFSECSRPLLAAITFPCVRVLLRVLLLICRFLCPFVP